MTTDYKHPSRYNLASPGTSNAKTRKAAPEGAQGARPYANLILYLAPHNVSGIGNVCPWAGACAKGCLFTAGRGAMNNVQRARIRRTRLLMQDPSTFHDLFMQDVQAFITRADAQGYVPVIRANGTSDLPIWRWPAFDRFRDAAIWYDYTKRDPRVWGDVPGYHRTYSYDPVTDPTFTHLRDALSMGANVAVVFDTPKGDALPDTWRGVPVIDGRTHDYRFLDPQGVIVGLSALGKAKGDYSFVQKAG